MSTNPYQAPTSTPSTYLPGGSVAASYESAHGRALLAQGLLGLQLLLAAVAIVAFVGQLNLLEQAGTAAGITEEEANANDALIGLIGLAQIAAYIATVVVFLMWLHRTTKNLPALGAGELEISPGWAVGSWFVPFLNLVRPYQAVRDAWKASSPQLPQDNPVAWKKRSGSPLIGFWWAAWIISGIAGQITLRMTAEAATLPELITLTKVSMFADGLTVLAALLAIAVVRSIDQRQTDRYDRMAGATPLMGPAFA